MAYTNFNLLTTEQKTIWSMDFWKQARNLSFVNRFMGTGPNSLIQRITELKKTEKGARAVITLLADLEGDGVAGDRTLRGNEDQNKSYDQVIRMDQHRNATIHEGRMADQKSVVDYRETSRDTQAYWISDRIDQLAFLTLSGVAYSIKNNGAARVGSDLVNLEFAADVTGPTSARRLRWDNTAGALITSGATSAVEADDTVSYKLLVYLKAYAKNEYMRGVREAGGGEAFHVFMTPTAMSKLKLDPDYQTALKYAAPRDMNNPWFTGETVKVDGLYLHEFRHVYNTSGLAGGSKWGAGGAIDGCQLLFCGAQSLAMADIGMPYWEEEGFDYQNQQGISVGKIYGMRKPTFNTQYGTSAGTVQDFGVISVYVAQ